MATSTIPDFKGALRDRLAADLGLTGVVITWGWPFGGLPREMVMLSNARPDDPTGGRPGGQSTAAMGQNRREERVAHDVYIRVQQASEQEAVTLRAFEICGVLETSLRAWQNENPQFGGVVRWALVTSVGLDESPTADDAERVALVTVEIATAQRL